MFAAILHGFTCANFGTHDGQGRNKVRFDKFLQGGKSPHLGKYFVGSSSRPQTGGQTLTNEASIEGRFRFTGKNLAYDRQRFDRTTAWAFNKK